MIKIVTIKCSFIKIFINSSSSANAIICIAFIPDSNVLSDVYIAEKLFVEEVDSPAMIH